MPSLKPLREGKESLVPIKANNENTGLWLRPIPFEELEKLNNFPKTEEGGRERILYLFVNFICDENGEAFDDVTSVEEVKKNVDALLFKHIMNFLDEIFSANLPKEPE